MPTVLWFANAPVGEPSGLRFFDSPSVGVVLQLCVPFTTPPASFKETVSMIFRCRYSKRAEQRSPTVRMCVQLVPAIGAHGWGEVDGKFSYHLFISVTCVIMTSGGSHERSRVT